MKTITERRHNETLIIMLGCTLAIIVWVPLLIYLLLRDSIGITFVIPITPSPTHPGIQAIALLAYAAIRPYESMNCVEVITHWSRMKAKAPDGHSLFMSPNKALWAIVDEQRNQTLQMWDVNTGYVYRQQEPKSNICVHCGHEIRWEFVAVPPRWEHVRVMSNDEASRLHWICECGCMTPEPKEAS